MFKKEKQPTYPPFVLQVLTTEYLLEGTVPGDAVIYFSSLGLLDSEQVVLTSASIKPAGAVDIPVRTCDQFRVMGALTVAFIPLTDVSQLKRYKVWKIPEVAVRGLFYFGPYTIQGTLKLAREGYFEEEMPMFDVRITSRIPGAHLGVLQAPFALVSGRWLMGYEPE